MKYKNYVTDEDFFERNLFMRVSRLAPLPPTVNEQP